MKKITRAKISMSISVFAGVAFAYFIWLSWTKLIILIGDSNIVWGITGAIVLLAIFGGYFGVNKIAKRFI